MAISIGGELEDASNLSDYDSGAHTTPFPGLPRTPPTADAPNQSKAKPFDPKSSAAPPDYDQEEEWQTALRTLQSDLDAYNSAKNSGDATAKLLAADVLVASMKRLARIHPDPEVKKKWEEQAARFSNGDEKEKENILAGLGKGLAILLVTPFALVGGVLFGAGAIIYGVGKVVVGLGNLLTFGQLR